MEFSYNTQGTCSSKIFFEINDDDKTLHNVSFVGGCSGNLQGISHLVEGMTAEDALERLKGIACGDKPTSCGDQFARAIKAALDHMEKNQA